MEEADLIIYFKTKEGHFSLVTVLKTNTKGSQERCPGQLEHQLHVLVVRGRGEVQLHVALGLHPCSIAAASSCCPAYQQLLNYQLKLSCYPRGLPSS